MANIPNRAGYGLLGCLKGVVDSRYISANQEQTLTELKHDDSKPKNAIDCCPGGVPFSAVVAQRLSRKKYCPFLDSSTDSRICQWVHSIMNDPQKSKPVGQCAIILEGLGLVDLDLSANGNIRKLKWNATADNILKNNWGSVKLDVFFSKKLLEYGPVLGIVFFGNAVSNKNVFSKSSITPYINFPLTNEKVSIKCKCKTIYDNLILPDGNTSRDAASRSTKTLLCLAASAGLVLPTNPDYISHSNISKIANHFPSYFYNWYMSNPKRKCPNNWIVNIERVNKLLHSGKSYKFSKGISYNNLIPKSTDRNKTSQCPQCKTNLVNYSKKMFGDQVKNRRYLLLESLRVAYDQRKKLSLKQLSDISSRSKEFSINKSTHLKALTIDIQVADLTGFWVQREGNVLTPLIGADKKAFDPVPTKIAKAAMDIIKSPGVLI